MKKDFKRFLITWLVLFIIIDFAMGAFGFKKDRTKTIPTDGGIVLEAIKDEITIGKEVFVNIKNYTDQEITVTDENCIPLLKTFKYETGVWVEKEIPEGYICEHPELINVVLQPGQDARYSFLQWNYELFGELGRYKVTLEIDKEYTSPEFTIKKRGFFKRSWDFLFYKPIYNTLIFFTDINPSHSLGIAIILLTLLIRVILLVPSQKALRSQKRLQEIQPKIQEIQRKYKGNQERIAMETMALWKSAKANPLGSCLPILLQFPILIALYFAVREVTIGGAAYNLYAFQENFDFSTIHTIFLNTLDLAEKNIIALPIIVGLLQFTQMKLTFAMRKTPKQKTPPKKKDDGMPDMQTMNKTMTYTMPIMIAFFTATLPAGVGLYWGTSTIFAIGQTLVINREKSDEIQSKNSDEVTVKVVEKTEEEVKKETKEKYLPKGKKKKNR